MHFFIEIKSGLIHIFRSNNNLKNVNVRRKPLQLFKINCLFNLDAMETLTDRTFKSSVFQAHFRIEAEERAHVQSS